MNIGIIVDNEFHNDIRVTREVKILKQAGFSVFVLCFGYSNNTYPIIKDIILTRIKINRRVKNILFLLFNRIPLYELLWESQTRKFIRSHSIHVLHVHDLYMSKAAYNAAKSFEKDIPMILDLHENFPVAIKSYNWVKGAFRRFLANPDIWQEKEFEYLNYARKLVVLSEDYKKYLCRSYSAIMPENVLVFPNIIDVETFDSYPIDSSIIKHGMKSSVLLYFGVVAERRGIFQAIDTLKEVILKGFDITLLVIGPVDKADSDRFDKEKNDVLFQKHIVHIPWIDISHLPTYLYNSDICLAPFIKNPQHESGVANKIFQYMYGKKAIIASDCKPQKDIIERFNCGLVFSDQEEFTSNVIKLLQDKSLCKQMGENGYVALMEYFDSKSNNDKLLEHYKEMIPV